MGKIKQSIGAIRKISICLFSLIFFYIITKERQRRSFTTFYFLRPVLKLFLYFEIRWFQSLSASLFNTMQQWEISFGLNGVNFGRNFVTCTHVNKKRCMVKSVWLGLYAKMQGNMGKLNAAKTTSTIFLKFYMQIGNFRTKFFG